MKKSSRKIRKSRLTPSDAKDLFVHAGPDAMADPRWADRRRRAIGDQAIDKPEEVADPGIDHPAERDKEQAVDKALKLGHHMASADAPKGQILAGEPAATTPCSDAPFVSGAVESLPPDAAIARVEDNQPLDKQRAILRQTDQQKADEDYQRKAGLRGDE